MTGFIEHLLHALKHVRVDAWLERVVNYVLHEYTVMI